MNQASASFRSIEIRRMPGFQRGELALPDLCAGINVIYGPNASGKTTLCRAIHRLLRPADPGGGDVSLRASLQLDGAGFERATAPHGQRRGGQQQAGQGPAGDGEVRHRS